MTFRLWLLGRRSVGAALLALFIAFLFPAIVRADGGQCYRIFLPIMAKTDLLRTIDQNTDTASFIEDQYYRPADETAPPTPTGFSVDDAPGGVQARVDFNTDKAHGVSDFDCFILYRVAELDANGDPIGTPVEVSRFSSATAFVSVQPPGRHYYYAVKARDHYDNKSDYSEWHLGLSLRDTGVADDFGGYGGNEQVTNDDELYWLQLANFDADEGWTAGSNTTVTYITASTGAVEGDSALKMAADAGGTISVSLTKSLDLTNEGRFATSDFLLLYVYMGTASSESVIFDFYSAGGMFYIDRALRLTPGGHFLAIAPGWFTGYGDWSAITSVDVGTGTSISAGEYMIIDDLRLVKASALDATTYSDTGDLWTPRLHDNTSATTGEWHVYQDMPGADFSLGNIKTAAGEPYIITREDRPQDSATHAAMIELREDGQAGMMFRVQPGLVQAATPTLNAQFTNSSAETVGKTHTPTATSLTYADSATLGAYAIKNATSDVLSYASVSLVDSRGEATIHLAFSPDYAYTGADNYIFYHRSNLQIYYNATYDKFYADIVAGGSRTTLTSAVQTFAANDNIVLDVVIDGTSAALYVNGELADSDTLAGLVSDAAATLYIAQTSAGIFDYTGKIYQVLIDWECASADEVAAWYAAFLAGHKVASPDQRNYYALEVDTVNDQLELNEYRIGWNVISLADPLSFTASPGVVYHVAAILDNIDDDGDGDNDTLRIRGYGSDTLNTLFNGASQKFSLALTTGQLWSGYVGFKADGINARFGDFRAGSPHRAHVAERAKIADYATGLQLAVVDAAPTTDNLAAGNMVLYKNGTTYRLYANVSGSIKYLTFSPFS